MLSNSFLQLITLFKIMDNKNKIFNTYNNKRIRAYNYLILQKIQYYDIIKHKCQYKSCKKVKLKFKVYKVFFNQDFLFCLLSFKNISTNMSVILQYFHHFNFFFFIIEVVV